MYSTPFWRLFDRLAAICLPACKSRVEAAEYCAWTNLTKTGVVGESAPPVNDFQLRELDLRQFRHEADLLQPDILVCVSGSLMVPTAMELFQSWPEIQNLKAQTASTWIRRSPWNGILLWTMHPAYKPETWLQSIESDLRGILEHLPLAKASENTSK